MPKVSVIVPIYNAEKTIRRCVDSLLAQTMQDFEILLIDDGSPDGCAVICDEYAQRDNRIKVFHKVNGGVSSARLFGIDHAQGEYTIHADPDDWVDSTMLEELYKKAEETDADMLICDFYENTYKGQKYVKQEPSANDHFIVQKELFQQLHGSCCNKLVRRACYNNNGVKFPKGISFCEDLYVMCALLMNDIKVAYLPKAFYHYVRNDVQSLSRRYTFATYDEDCLRKKLFAELLDGSPNYASACDVIELGIVSRAFWGGRHVFSSKDFQRLFGKYSRLVKRSDWAPVKKYFILCSCQGYYKLMRILVEGLLNMKHFLYGGKFK